MTDSAWIEVTVENMPPLELPVWLYDPTIRSPIIGCRTDDSDGWLWARCYDDFWWDEEWKTATADEEDLKPSHWMPLPIPPNP